MGFKTWLYHSDHEAKIFDSDAVPELEKQGWRDSPAKLPVKTAVEDKRKVKPALGKVILGGVVEYEGG